MYHAVSHSWLLMCSVIFMTNTRWPVNTRLGRVGFLRWQGSKVVAWVSPKSDGHHSSSEMHADMNESIRLLRTISMAPWEKPDLIVGGVRGQFQYYSSAPEPSSLRNKMRG